MPMPDDCDPIQDAKHARETAAVLALDPKRALAAWEAADARKRAARAEVEAADHAWVTAAKVLAEAIEYATDGTHNREPVLIAGKVVTVKWDDYWTVKVQTPPVLG
jgi:hypothetical protein